VLFHIPVLSELCRQPVLENFVFIIHETTALQTSSFKALNGYRDTSENMHSLSTNHFLFEDIRNYPGHTSFLFSTVTKSYVRAQPHTCLEDHGRKKNKTCCPESFV